jgi:hypothetical protein
MTLFEELKTSYGLNIGSENQASLFISSSPTSINMQELSIKIETGESELSTPFVI